MQTDLPKKSNLVSLVIVAIVAFTVGAWLSPLKDVAAEVRGKPTPAGTFKSGGERSEIVLRQIAQTLKTMDGRLQSIERDVKKASSQR
jgi:hypothetical protein